MNICSLKIKSSIRSVLLLTRPVLLRLEATTFANKKKAIETHWWQQMTLDSLNFILADKCTEIIKERKKKVKKRKREKENQGEALYVWLFYSE